MVDRSTGGQVYGLVACPLRAVGDIRVELIADRLIGSPLAWVLLFLLSSFFELHSIIRPVPDRRASECMKLHQGSSSVCQPIDYLWKFLKSQYHYFELNHEYHVIWDLSV